MQYNVIKATDLHSFIKGVNEAISFGWKPQGGILYDTGRYYQAMVKE